MSAAAIDPTTIDWHGADGLDYRAKVRDGVLIFKPRIRSLKDFILWASGKSNYLISKVLNVFWNATSFSSPATLYFALWTATLTAASTGATAGEASYTGYARVAMTANTTNFPLSTSGGAIQNAVAVTWAASSSATQTITFVAVLDAATLGTGNITYWGSITSTPINNGDTAQINVNAMTATEA